MTQLNQREQSLIDSLNNRLAEADTLQADQILKELESSEEYKTPSHPDHLAYLHMIPITIGKQMELRGEQPYASGTDADSSMLDNQRFTHDIFPQEPTPLDFSQDEQRYQTQRNNLSQHLTNLQNNNVKHVSPDDKTIHIEATQKEIIKLDLDYKTNTQARNIELDRIDTLESDWEAEKRIKSAEMKKDFMTSRLQSVLKDDEAKVTELAEIEWGNLKLAYGF